MSIIQYFSVDVNRGIKKSHIFLDNVHIYGLNLWKKAVR